MKADVISLKHYRAIFNSLVNEKEFNVFTHRALTLEKNKILPPATTLDEMTQEDIVLSKLSPLQKEKYCGFAHTWGC